MATMSEKARAFSVDSLLGQTKREHDAAKRTQQEGSMCSSLGEGPPCCHANSQIVYDGSGEQNITVDLCQSDLWQSFHNLGTEMIITKSGRRMFPAIRVRVSGLKKHRKYRVFMDFIPVDRNKYRYVYHNSKWMVSGNGEVISPDQSYQHPDSPMEGNFMNAQVISFERIKLTNHDRPRPGQISLLSMQKFQPRVHVEELEDNGSDVAARFLTSFPQTAFIAVTAYQNQEITRLKIERNPFAKGFREAGKCRSSLEAMMASFGVVIDNKDSLHHNKRHVSSFSESDVDNQHVTGVKRARCRGLDVPYDYSCNSPAKCVSHFRDIPVEHLTSRAEHSPSRNDVPSTLVPRFSHADSVAKLHPAFRWSIPAVVGNHFPQHGDHKLYSSEAVYSHLPPSLMYFPHPIATYPSASFPSFHSQLYKEGVSRSRDQHSPKPLALDKS